jgi:UDP-MurNAc hydroxylase
MEITVLGHASYLVRASNGTQILIDPVLKKTHQEGLLETYPSRSIKSRELNRSHLILISHRHMDHFDVSSLVEIDRSKPIIIPQDRLMERALRSLRFESIIKLGPYSTATVDGVAISLTPSLASIPECGFVIEDGETKIWDQVDSAISPEIIEDVRRRHGRFDLAFVPWQPLQDLLPSHGGALEFPYDAYARLLEHTRRMQARHVILGACGFRYCGQYSGLNHVVFPQSRARAIQDFNRIKGQKNGFAFYADPGDLINVNENQLSIQRNGSSVARRSANWDDLHSDWCPWNPSWASMKNSSSILSTELGTKTRSLLRTWIRKSQRKLRTYRRWDVVYNLRIVHDGTHVEDLSVDFRPKSPAVRAERAPDASLSCFIRSGALQDLLEGRITWDHAMLSGDMFHCHRVYRVTKDGVELPKNVSLPNPLFEVIRCDASWLRFHSMEK